MLSNYGMHELQLVSLTQLKLFPQINQQLNNDAVRCCTKIKQQNIRASFSMSDDGNTLGNLISTVLGNKNNLINARSKVCNKMVADKNVDA